MTNDLLPCPFCGASAYYNFTDAGADRKYYRAHCSKCDARIGHPYVGKDAAATAWNTRANKTAEVDLDAAIQLVRSGFIVRENIGDLQFDKYAKALELIISLATGRGVVSEFEKAYREGRLKVRNDLTGNMDTVEPPQPAATAQIDAGELEKSIWYCREDWQHKDGYEALYEHMDVIIKAARATGETTDGYHTLNELYEHRHILFLSVLAANIDRAWRSKLHNDGTMFDGWFIAGLKTVMGQATYHLPIRMWSLFHLIPELEKAPPFDGHTAEDTLKRLRDDVYFKHKRKK